MGFTQNHKGRTLKGGVKMKIWLFTLLSLLLGFSLAFSQSTDTTGVKKEKSKSSIEQSLQKGKREKAPKASTSGKREMKGFVDLNANGIDDRVEEQAKGKGKRKQHGKRLRKDRFIDRDGDGIYDGQESALGLQKLYMRRHRKAGKK